MSMYSIESLQNIDYLIFLKPVIKIKLNLQYM